MRRAACGPGAESVFCIRGRSWICIYCISHRSEGFVAWQAVCFGYTPGWIWMHSVGGQLILRLHVHSKRDMYILFMIFQ